MPLCPACQREVDDASRAAGRCAQCGASLHPIAQRTISDIRRPKPVDATDFEVHDQTVELPAGGLVEPISIELRDDLIGDSLPDATGGSTVTGNAVTGSPAGSDTVAGDDSDFVVHDATLELPEALDLSELPSADDDNRSSNPTLPEIKPSDLKPQDSSLEPSAEDPNRSSNPTLPEIPIAALKQGGGKPPSKNATITMGPEQTIEFSGSASNIDESMLTSQWQGGLPSGGGANLGATIKQKETITGTYVSSSSLIVKSRHVSRGGGGGAAARPTSPADAPDYELLNVIGEGGMGVVYAARQSSIARTVALKMLKSEDADASQRDKFISEAVVTGELDHPNIVPIYDLGANDDGALFYSMKRVKGTPWHKVIRERSLDENLNILLRVADAVAFAHVNGVVHRDLKPENVMLGDFGEVLVMDWGLARVGAQFPSVAAVTQSDAMGGTPAYMAPEMATGPLEKITPASDIYLLGAILYEIITGKPPHTGKTVMACLFSAAKNTIAPTDKTGELVEIALKAMSTASELRHTSVQHFQAAVREYQAHAESLRLLHIADANIAKGAQTQDYEQYARAIYALEESLTLWPGNRKAKTLLAGARIEYARLALDKGDYDLGASLLDPADQDHGPVLAQLHAGRSERESRQRRIKFLKGAVAALVASVVGVVSVAYFAVSKQRDEAVFQKGVAVQAQGVAVKAQGEAEVARGQAVEQRDRAVTAEAETKKSLAAEQVARQAEEEQRQLAEQKRREAEEQRALADEARIAADAARADEAYSAYIARIGLTKVKLDENAFDRASALLDECPENLRAWEWGRLKFLTQRADRTWTAAAPLDAIAFAPDGRHFATGGRDSKAIIWSLDAEQPEHEFPQGQYVHSVTYDRAGKRLAAGSSDGTVNIYDVATGERLAQLKGHEEGVLSVRFSSDGTRLLSSGYDTTARLWDIATQRELQVLRGHSYWVWAAEFSPDGRRLLTAGQDGKAIVWQAQPGSAGSANATELQPPVSSLQPLFTQLTNFTQHRGPIFAARFSPTGNEVATAGEDGRILLWNPDVVQPVDIQKTIDNLRIRGTQIDSKPPTPPPFRELAGHRGPVRTLAYAPDGASLASGGQDNVLFLWNVATGQQLKELRGHASHVRACDFAPNGQQLLSAGRDQQIKLWSPAAYGETRSLAADDALDMDVLSARFAADGSEVITASRDRTASLWDAATLARKQWFQEGHDFLASSAAFFADGTRVATAAGDGTVRLWNVATGAETQRLPGTGYTAAVDVADNGRWVATSSSVAGEALVWNAATGEKVATLTGHNSEVTAVAFAPGGQLLATGDNNGHCRLWRYDAAANQWREGARLDGHSRTITALAFVDGGQRLISASGDNSCGQWDVASGRELTDRVLRHPEWVADMAATPDGKFALTCCDDGKLRLWDLADAKLLRTLETTGDAANFTSVDVSADGKIAAAACAAEGTVRLWDLATGEELTATKATGSAGGLESESQASSLKPQAFLNYGAGAGRVWAARFAPTSDALLVIGGNDAQMLDLETRKPTARFSPHGVVASADVSPDGTRVVTGSWDRTAKIWDAATGKVLVKLPALHTGYINSVCFSPDGATILTASDDGTARLWNALTGEPLELILRSPKGPIHQACFSPDGARILTAGDDRVARIWDAATGAELAALEGHKWPVRCGAFSADGALVITGSDDNNALVWNLAAGTHVPLEGHTAAVTAAAISPDGRRALTGSQDNAAKLWDTVTGKEILTLAGHDNEVTAAAFSPDGLTALTSGRDGRTLLWPAVDWAK